VRLVASVQTAPLGVDEVLVLRLEEAERRERLEPVGRVPANLTFEPVVGPLRRVARELDELR
jgi:hypothetical protein